MKRKEIIGFIYALILQCSMPAWIYSQQEDPMQSSFLLEVLSKLDSGQNIIFTKYGDGEYNCMIRESGCNVDEDSYHEWLGLSLRNALVSLCKKPNVYIGKWWSANVYEYCNEVAWENGTSVPWAWYHLVLNDDMFFLNDYMHRFVEFVVHSKRKKILICNASNYRLKDFFQADVYIEIPSKNWSFQYGQWRDAVEKCLEKDAIVLISGGMCSKVLIDDITNQYDITCIDLGSSFDLLGSGQPSRAHKHSYKDEVLYYKDFLPLGWESLR